MEGTFADPVHIWLKDEQMEAVGGLRTFPTQKGVSPLGRLIRADGVNSLTTRSQMSKKKHDQKP